MLFYQNATAAATALLTQEHLTALLQTKAATLCLETGVNTAQQEASSLPKKRQTTKLSDLASVTPLIVF